jgi:hypothetical protein
MVLAMLAAACGDASEASTTSSAAPSSSTTAATTTTTTSPPATSTTVPVTLAPPPVFDRWTTILASLPEGEYDEATATEAARGRSEPGVGVLRSADYPSLNPGYWVVFSGDFASEDEAIAHCRRLQDDGVACYHRFLGEAPLVVAGREHGTAVAWVGDRLALVDPANGGIVSEVPIEYGENVTRGVPQLAPDGTGVYVELKSAEAFTRCETATGRIDRVDLTTGAATMVAAGLFPQISPDGARLAYVAISHCEPSADPAAEVTFYPDTLAVLDLASGRILQWRPSPGAAATAGSIIDSVAWAADGTQMYVAMASGPLHVVDLGFGAALDATPQLGPGRVGADFGAWVLEGLDAGGRLVAVEWDYELVTSRVIEINPSSGRVVDAEPPLDGFAQLRLDRTGTARLLTVEGRLVTPSATFGPDPFFGGADW